MKTPALVKACLCALVLSCTAAVAANGQMPPSPQEEGLLTEPVALEVAAETADPARDVVFPPPGTHRVPKGDTVVLQGRRTGVPDCPPVWSGDAPGSPAFAVPVVMDGAKRTVAAFGGDCIPSTGLESFAAPDTGALHAFLGSGDLYGWFSVNRARPGYGAGITHMVSGEYPYAPVFMRPNLNFEHIMNGCVADAPRAQNTPRMDPMELRFPSPSCVEIRWPAQSSAWKLDCVMRYAFTGRNAVDMEFEVTPRADEAPLGYLLFMWASYMHKARARTIHFPGVRDGVEGWTEFGGDLARGGTVAGIGQAALTWENDANALNLSVFPNLHFTEPVYYGLVDGDQNEQTSDDTMAFIMMFDSPESTRFAVWNWGDDPHSSAWDWQYVVRLPEVGRTYRQRARMVYKRFQGPDDVLAEFQAWRDASPPAEGGAVLPLRSLPAILSPGENGHNPVLLADKAVQQDPAFALAAYRRLLGAPAYQALAAEHIDALFDRANDLAGLIAVWESVAAEDSRGALAWGRLGSARLRAGDIEQAAGAFQRGLDRDANDRQCRLGMGTVSVLQGGLEDGLALLDGLVAESPGHARPAGKACADAAGAHARAGRGDIALQLYQRAMAYWPDDLGFCLEYGELLQSMGRDAEALGQYRSIVTRDPEAPHTSQLIDGIYARWNDATGRVEEWRAVVGMHPDACIPRWCLGMALENAGDFAGAETAFRDAIQRGPKQQEPKIWLGAVIAAAGDLGGGLDLMEGAVDALPELAGAAAEACARAAKARFAAGDLSGALTLLRCARILSPTDLRHAVLFGETLEAAGDDDGALSEYRTVVGQVPDSPHSSARMDAILEKRGEKAARVEEWRGLAAANPDAAIPQLHLGLALEALGDMAGAEAAYCKALSLDPEAESGSACFKRVKTHREGDR